MDGLSNVTVSDSPTQAISPILVGSYNNGDTNHNNLLDVNETWHYKATGTAVDTSSLPQGMYSNTATATTNPDTDVFAYSTTPTAQDGSWYTGHAAAIPGLTKGYWATHFTVWNVVK